jgi:hypothetical protein
MGPPAFCIIAPDVVGITPGLKEKGGDWLWVAGIWTSGWGPGGWRFEWLVRPNVCWAAYALPFFVKK